MMRFSFSLLCCLVLALSPGLSARAEEAPAPVATMESTVKIAEPNPALQSTLQLQTQIQILKRLLAHEQSVSAMVKAAIAIGLRDPALPRPDKELCEQVPGNIVCASAWPDLYKDFGLKIAANKSKAPVVAATPPDIKTMPRVTKDVPDVAEQLPVPEPAAAVASLYWMDITCVQEKCSAVISPEPNNPNARYRITPGETLPDGATVSAISAAGVTLRRDDADVRLEPAPQA